MKFSELFTDPKDGRFSHTKLWNHVGLFLMSLMFLWYSYHFKIDEWMLFAYGVLVTHQNMLGKYLSFRFGESNNNLQKLEDKKENQ